MGVKVGNDNSESIHSRLPPNYAIRDSTHILGKDSTHIKDCMLKEI